MAPESTSTGMDTNEPEDMNLLANQVIGVQEQTFSQKFWYVVRRWPIVPMAILAMMVFAGVFAPLLSPTGPREINLRGRAAPPTWQSEWYEANPKN